jgi:co-chaperonin GroES (HSP10)
MYETIENFYPETGVAIMEEPAIQYGPFTPILDRVLLKRIAEDNRLVKGSDTILAADQYKARSNKGVVIAVGEKVLTLQPGDLVLFGDFNAEDFERDGEEFVVVWLGDIRGYERPL